ncbi:cyclic peptide export ABC transporter [Robbsia sp. KACC 23696]|uniref:cyclic peptide export ABC transporter n=1 Tax=Robbsia sp. KACC 23696 TaxID=3149231 RepID=UPI00325BEC67
MGFQSSDGNRVQVGQELYRLLKPFWPITFIATALGAIGGLSTAWLLATINDGLHAEGGISTRLLVTFLALCALTLVGNAVAGTVNSMIGQKVVAMLRKDISSRIVCAPIAAIERYKIHRMLSTLNSDVDTVSAFSFSFPSVAVALAITIGSLVYMIVLSPMLFLLALVAIVVGALINQYASWQWDKQYRGVRGAQDELQKQYRAITQGAKELRINRERRVRVFDVQLSAAADQIATLKTRAMRLFYTTNAAGSTLFFLIIGLIILLQHRLGLDARVVSGFVIVLLYVRGPVEQIAGALPGLVQARVSFQRIAELSAEFANVERDLLVQPAPGPAMAPGTLALRGATYRFPQTSDVTPFSLGPIDLTVEQGETVFIIGENGCGKTTLIKLLLGLYSPAEGTLCLGGHPVSPSDLDAYRQLFSAVFADYHLFDDLIAPDPALLASANDYLKQLEIAHKVDITDGAFSTTDLSTGQRKRLALVHAMLEQRPIMMFDEWAADQDPTFRRFFYRAFLPELKRQGKTLIVVSHDDRYFDVADKVVRLENGKIIQTSRGDAFVYEHRTGGQEDSEGV